MSERPNSCIEPVPMIPVFADGLAGIEIDRNGIARVMLFAEHREAYEGSLDRIVVARLIIPREAMVEIAERMLAAARAEPPSMLSLTPRPGLN